MQRPAIPYRKQENLDIYCGPAVVQMILLAHGLERSQDELATILGTDATGTRAQAIEEFLMASGFFVERKNDAMLADIEAAHADGATVVVGYIEPGENLLGHYGIVMDLTDDSIVLIDPLLGPELTMSREDFQMRWKDDHDDSYGERMMMSIVPSHE
jgi:ABC-type bacteriocin/lantibiotic exporter with double-glycine peptidase domain